MSIEFRVVSRELRVNSRDAMHRRRCIASRLFSSLITRNSQLATRHAVTLVELLITITIITILSASFLGVSNLAMESAREARTKTTIGKIHSLLMEKWAEYATRRVDVNLNVKQQFKSNIEADTSLTNTQKARLIGRGNADLRLLATRELMKLEMPDRWSDVLLNGVPTSSPLAAGVNGPSILSSLPALTSTYRRRYFALRSQDTTPLDGNRIRQHQGAECLYMTVMLSTGDGEARTLFSESDIGDTDGDGAPEFLDGWGRPIDFIRWPAGFWERSDLMGGPLLADQDHDPLDLFRRDQVGIALPDPVYFPNLGVPSVRQLVNQLRNRNNNAVLRLPDNTMSPVSAFRLIPLIFSSGADGVTDINASPGFVVDLDPYAIDGSDPVFQFGVPADGNSDGDDNSLDNIHNHLQDNR